MVASQVKCRMAEVSGTACEAACPTVQLSLRKHQRLEGNRRSDGASVFIRKARAHTHLGRLACVCVCVCVCVCERERECVCVCV